MNSSSMSCFQPVPFTFDNKEIVDYSLSALDNLVNDHHPNCHDEDLFLPRNDCSTLSSLPIDLEMHTNNKHDPDQITQLDGLNQDLFVFSNIASNSVRSANYTLNHEKQMTKIRNDASKNDYEVTINNNDENATIKCSSGFYIQVAKSCFVTLDKRSVLSQSDVAITVDDITVTNDKNGLEVTRLIHFSFMSEQKTIGGVAVHLHHSTRTIQVQGSCIMPDSSSAVVWFINSVTIKRFRELAKTKKFDIKNFNESVKKLPQNPAPGVFTSDNSCQACYSIFNTQSKPSRCNFCSKFFHKSSCLKDHIRTCKARSDSSNQSYPSIPLPPSSLPSATAKPSAQPWTSSQPSIPTIKSSITFIPAVSSSVMSPTSSSATTSSPSSSPPTASTATLPSSQPSTLFSSKATSKAGNKKKQKSIQHLLKRPGWISSKLN